MFTKFKKKLTSPESEKSSSSQHGSISSSLDSLSSLNMRDTSPRNPGKNTQQEQFLNVINRQSNKSADELGIASSISATNVSGSSKNLTISTESLQSESVARRHDSGSLSNISSATTHTNSTGNSPEKSMGGVFSKRTSKPGESMSLPRSASPLASPIPHDDLPEDGNSGRSRFSMMFSPSSSTSRDSLTQGLKSSDVSNKRMSRRLDSDTKSGTFRFSKRFFESMGFEDFKDDGSILSFSVEGDEGDVDSSEVDASLMRQIPVQIYLKDNKTSITYKIHANETVSEIIKGILIQNGIVEEYDKWRLCKIDRSLVAMRRWLPLDTMASVHDIKDGDEFRLKNVGDLFQLQFRIPPSTEIQTISYDFDASVKSVVETINQKNTSANNNNYGLYYKKVGLWLDEKKSMVSYEIDAENVLLEFRQLSQEFLLRVNLPEVDSRFTLKVIPALSIVDVLAMIDYNIKTKRIQLEHTRDFTDIYTPRFASMNTSNVRGIVYGLFDPGRNQWLSEQKTLEECGINGSGEVFFKIRHQPMTIMIPTTMASMRNDLMVTFGADGKFEKRNLIHVLCSEQTTVNDLEQLLQIDSGFQGALFTRGQERLKESDLAWKVLSDNSPMEIFEFKTVPLKLKLTFAPDASIDIEFDPIEKISSLVSLACRRFGLDEVADAPQLKTNNGRILDPKKTLKSSKFDCTNETVQLETSNSGTNISSTMWLELFQEDLKNITFANDGSKIVTTASLNRLIERLTSSDAQSDSADYLDLLKTFLLTYHSFTTPQIFLQKLIERYHVPKYPKSQTFMDFEKQRLRIQLRIANVFQQWTKKYYFDFVDFSGNVQLKLLKHSLLLSVLDFVERILVVDHPTIGRQVRKNIFRLCDGTHTSFNKRQLQQQQSEIISPTPSVANFDNRSSLFACDSLEIAKQLTLNEYELFSRIMPYEFLNQAWTRKDADQKSPNVLQITKSFNDIALWVAKSILEVKSVKARAKRFSKLIDIAGYLYTLNNYSTLMAFVAGFNKAAINRLKYTAKEIGTKSLRKFAELEKIMSAEGAYKNYRTKLRSANPPCIPYIGVYLLDLTYIEDGNPDTIDGLINFSKRRLIYSLIREVQVFQDTPYSIFKSIDKVQLLLSNSMALPVQELHPSSTVQQPFATLKEYEDHLFQLSLQREPRGAERNQIN